MPAPPAGPPSLLLISPHIVVNPRGCRCARGCVSSRCHCAKSGVFCSPFCGCVGCRRPMSPGETRRLAEAIDGIRYPPLRRKKTANFLEIADF